MAIAIENTNQGFSTSSTASVTMNGISGNKMIAIVMWFEYNVSRSVSSVTLNTGGQSFTKVPDAEYVEVFDSNYYCGISLWYLDNPNSGDKTVDIVMSGETTRLYCIAWELSGARSGAPADDQHVVSAGDVSSLGDYVTCIDGALSISGIVTKGNFQTISSSGGQTRDQYYSQSVFSTAGGSRLESGAGNKYHEWSWSTAVDAHMITLSISPPSLIGKINGIDLDDIAKINGILIANIGKVNGF